MQEKLKADPVGDAIWDYYLKNEPEDIVVVSDLSDDDILPIDHLFRGYSKFPKLEKVAMQHCYGKILDVGAAAGAHTSYLLEKGLDVTTVEISPKAHSFLKQTYPRAAHYNSAIIDFNEGKYDTILLLMNGAGIAGDVDGVLPLLKHLANLLNTNGSILCDSTDVLDFFREDDGSILVDLTVQYYGNFKFKMKYKGKESKWFDWVYIDSEKLKELANEAGFSLTLLAQDGNSFLVKLNKI